MLRFAWWGSIGYEGYLFSKYNILNKINSKIKNSSHILFKMSILIIISIITRYMFEKPMVLDLIYTPVLFIYLLIISSKIKSNFIIKHVDILSDCSMNIWFLQALFFTPHYKLQFIAYFPKLSFIILVWSLLLMIIISIPVLKLQNIVIKKIFKEV